MCFFADKSILTLCSIKNGGFFYFMSKQAAQNTTNQITEGVIWKQLLIFFFPILFGTFFQQLYNTADAIIVGCPMCQSKYDAVPGGKPVMHLAELVAAALGNRRSLECHTIPVPEF